MFLQTADIHAPCRSRRVRNQACPWINSEIKKLSNHKDYLKKKAVKLNSSTFHETCKKCKNKVTYLIKNAKIHYFKTKLENSNNSKDSWECIGKLLNRKSKTTTINQIKINDQTVTGNENVANGLNKFFCEIGSKLADSIPTSNLNPLHFGTPSDTQFSFNQISAGDLYNSLNSLKMGKAVGPDKIQTNY